LFTLLSKTNYAAYPRGTTVENKRSFWTHCSTSWQEIHYRIL